MSATVKCGWYADLPLHLPILPRMVRGFIMEMENCVCVNKFICMFFIFSVYFDLLSKRFLGEIFEQSFVSGDFSSLLNFFFLFLSDQILSISAK